MRITAIIPNWNGGQHLAATLAGLSAQTRPVDEILVVDNGSADGSDAAAEAAGARVLRLGRNTGFAHAVNRGIEAAASPLLLILNNDVELHPNYVARALHILSQGGTWFVVGRLMQSGTPGVLDGTFDLLSRGGTAWRAGAGRPHSCVWQQTQRVWFPPLTAALLRRDLFGRAGKLDEEFGSYLEDVEFGLRCASKGYTGVYCPEAVAYHIGSATLGRWSPGVVYQIARNQVLLLARHYDRRMLWRSGWAIAVAQLLWGLVACRHGQGWAWLRGKLNGLGLFRRCRAAGGSGRTEEILTESERQLHSLQRETGFDRYWQMYFALTRKRG